MNMDRAALGSGCAPMPINRSDAGMNKEEGQEGGAEKGQQEGEGREGEKLFCLGHEHDAWEVREADASEWPPDF